MAVAEMLEDSAVHRADAAGMVVDGVEGRRKGGHGGEHGSIAMDLKDGSRKAASGRKVQ